MPTERTALYALNQAKLQLVGAAGEYTAEMVAELEELGVLVVLNIDDIADQVFEDYVQGESGVHESVVAAVELVMERACDG